MEILLVIILVMVGWNIFVTHIMVRELKREVLQLRSEVEHTKQSRMASFVRSTSTPSVDARGRTTRRDTDDIPIRGARMTQLTHKRKADDSPANDNRLPDGP